jgi:hypothetical protein
MGHHLPEHSGGYCPSRHFALQADSDMRSPMIAKSRPHVVIHTTHSSILCRVTTVSGEKMSHIYMEGDQVWPSWQPHPQDTHGHDLLYTGGELPRLT